MSVLLAWFDALERHKKHSVLQNENSSGLVRRIFSTGKVQLFVVFFFFSFSGPNSINSAKSAYGMSIRRWGMDFYERDCRIYRDSGPLRGKETSGRFCL